MIRTTFKAMLLTASATLAVSCASPFNGAEHAMTVAETHPIAVDSQVVTLSISADATTTDLSAVDKSRLRAFVDAYLINGHGPLTVTAPSGSGSDFDGQEMAADIRQALNDAGVPWGSITGATYRTGGDNGDNIIVSYTRYVATASKCGVWKGLRAADYRNMRSPNMGCATMNNYAAMISDPHDLIEPAEVSPRDGQSTTRAIELYRAGEVTASATDRKIEEKIAK